MYKIWEMLQWDHDYIPRQESFHDWACLLDMPSQLNKDYLNNHYFDYSLFIFISVHFILYNYVFMTVMSPLKYICNKVLLHNFAQFWLREPIIFYLGT